MNFSAGIRQLVLCSRDTLGTPSFNYPVFLGLGTEGKYMITDKTVKGYRDEDLPFMVNHKFEMKTSQMDFFILSRLIFHCSNRGVDCQIVTEKSGPDTYSGVYNLTGVNFAGIDFEWIHSNEENSLSVTGEVSLTQAASLQLLQNAITNIPLDLPSIDDQYGHRGIDPEQHLTPNPGIMQNPSGTSLVNGYEIIERKFSIKTVSKKLVNDRSSVKWLKFVFEITMDRSAAASLLSYLSTAKNASLTVQEKKDAVVNYTYNFGENIFFRKHEMLTDKNSGHIKLTFEKNLPLYDVEINPNTNVLSVSQAV